MDSVRNDWCVADSDVGVNGVVEIFRRGLLRMTICKMRRFDGPKGSTLHPRARAGVSVALKGVDGVPDYYAVDVGYVHAAVGGGVFEDLSFEAGVAYGFGELFAWAEESGDVLNAHASF